MSDIQVMTSQEAIEYVMDFFDYESIAKLSEVLSDNELQVQPIQVSYYRKGKMLMGQKVADRFYDTFGIEISNIFIHKGRPSVT